MRKQWLKTALVIFIGLCLQKVHALNPSVIYGEDNRLEYFELNTPAWQQRADATVALIRDSSLEHAGNQTNIKTVSFGQSMGLCASEPFYNQEAAAFCSGFLVAPDTIVTAGHCARSQSACESTKFVFGFRLERPMAQPRSVANDQVYSCARLVHSVVTPNGEDFAVIKLDRPVSHVRPLAYRRQGKPLAGDSLIVIGHPAGLPLKAAGSANVRIVHPEHLTANLDTYGGNSGSAVFNSVTGDVEGILVRGEMDFVYKNGCRVSNHCEDGTCRGEDVTLFERVLPYL